MQRNNPWISAAVEKLRNNPFVINTVLVVVLIALEKLVEVEFVCACDPKWNKMNVSLFFVSPTIVFFVLSLSIQRPRSCKAICSSCYPAISWIILLFLDGRYFACAKTDWSGTYTLMNGAGRQRWCNNSTLGVDSMLKTQEWYSISQLIGLGIAGVVTVLYGIIEFCFKKQCEKLQTCCCPGFIKSCCNDEEHPSPTNDALIPDTTNV
ncbi:uncharacterized protein LOC133443743 [Cololabis saira]|uniref:uncharacterized protein LOC133443743 n=1 Tax=Cololabis saira TaxID=129043 RepID=UPI002AD502C4|nr:uncharacterized protein LOC133443743 [Cololabis saira]